MKSEILAVGTELLMGQIANTNAQYISDRLPEAGVGVYYHTVVGDNPNRLKEMLLLAISRSDVIIMTGGLGPTKDDLTKETVADLFNRKLELHEESYKKIKNFFERINRPMVDSNVKQAYLPENSTIIENNNGTAPGCIIEESGKIIVLLPGPPSEMKPMFEDTVMPFLKAKTNAGIYSKFIKIFGLGESSMEVKIIDIIDAQSNPTIAPYVKEGEITLRITASAEDNAKAESLMEPLIQQLKSRLGTFIYSTDGLSLEEVVGMLLLSRKNKIAVAESCTGGLVSSRLTSISGISKVFDRGIVTYSNESKIQELGVQAQTIDDFGAVSEETAFEMAQGILKAANADIAISITGIAGPEGGTQQKPVGTVYIAIIDKWGFKACKLLNLNGTRNRIRNVAAMHALDVIRRYLIKVEIK